MFVRTQHRRLGESCASYIIDLKTNETTCVPPAPDLSTLIRQGKVPIRQTPDILVEGQTAVRQAVTVRQPLTVTRPKATSNAWEEFKAWLDKESISGVKNGYLAGGGGLLFAVALMGRGRRRR